MTTAYGTLYIAMFASVAITCSVTLGAIVAPRLLPVGRVLAVLAGLSGLGALTLRTIIAGHLPIFGTYENTLTAAWVLMASAALAVRNPRLHDVWRWAAPWSLILLMYGTQFRSEAVPLTISEQSIFVDVHVVFAWVAFTSLLGATTLSGLRLAGRSPLGMDAEEADALLSRLLLAGFASLTAMIALGSLYLYVLFGTFWRWEIVEIASLIAWLGYGSVLHLRLFYRRGGRTLDLWVVVLLPVLVIAFWIWSVFPGTYHFFDIPLMRPY